MSNVGFLWKFECILVKLVICTIISIILALNFTVFSGITKPCLEMKKHPQPTISSCLVTATVICHNMDYVPFH